MIIFTNNKKVIAMSKTSEMISGLENLANVMEYVDLKQSLIGLFDTIANSLIVSLLFLFMRI